MAEALVDDAQRGCSVLEARQIRDRLLFQLRGAQRRRCEVGCLQIDRATLRGYHNLFERIRRPLGRCGVFGERHTRLKAHGRDHDQCPRRCDQANRSCRTCKFYNDAHEISSQNRPRYTLEGAYRFNRSRSSWVAFQRPGPRLQFYSRLTMEEGLSRDKVHSRNHRFRISIFRKLTPTKEIVRRSLYLQIGTYFSRASTPRLHSSQWRSIALPFTYSNTR